MFFDSWVFDSWPALAIFALMGTNVCIGVVHVAWDCFANVDFSPERACCASKAGAGLLAAGCAVPAGG